MTFVRLIFKAVAVALVGWGIDRGFDWLGRRWAAV